MSMDTDGPRDGERMEKINVRVPAAMLEEINDEYERRGYTSRSEAIRDALRDWIEPPVGLSEETLTSARAAGKPIVAILTALPRSVTGSVSMATTNDGSSIRSKLLSTWRGSTARLSIV